MPSPLSRSLLTATALLAAGLACAGVVDGPDQALSKGGGRCGAMAAVEFWSGEYPSPVMQVDREVSLPARPDPCDERPSVPCAIPAGLYHPWAGQGRYLTLQESTFYRATAAFTYSEGPALRQGDTLELTHYLAEGMCALVHRGTRFDASCPDADNLPLELIREPATEPQQLFDPGCGAWLDVDSALFVRPEIQHGRITGYGEVGRSE